METNLAASSPVGTLLARLERVKGNGSGWTARCPAHDDRNPSLSVREGKDGRVLVRCHAGCSVEDILARVGLTMSDLFEQSPDRAGRTPARKRTGAQNGSRAANASKGEAGPGATPTIDLGDDSIYRVALLQNERELKQLSELRGWTPEALERLGVGTDGERVTLPYRDADGELVGLGRYQPDPDQRDGDPKLKADPGSRRELFPAPESVETDGWLWLVEGEPDCIRAHSLGLAAVAVPGVGSWRSEYAQRFAGRRVVVCFDCDEAGRKAAQRIAAELAPVAEDVRILDLDPARDDGFDLSDFATSAKTADERDAMRRILLDAAEHSPRVEPPKPGDIGALLDDVAAHLRCYVVMTDAQRDGLALWVAHTHAFQAAEATPYLHVTSAEPVSGKTRLFEAFELVVARPLKAGGTTAAALSRAVAQDDPPPTMLLDETDNTFKRDREYVAALMGILNDGYRRGGRTLLCLPPKWEPTLLPVFAPKALAGIGKLPDTVASRSIRIELKRRTPSEHVKRFRRREAEAQAAPLRERLSAWVAQHTDTLADARPSLPDELGDRAQDVWEPLLAIADMAGGTWPERARAAAVELSTGKPADDDSIGVRLLSDIRRCFDERGADRLTTAELLGALCADDEAPWGDWYGKPLSARTLAKLLKPYHVRPSSVKMPDGSTPKGYLREWLEDAFHRYLQPLSATAATLAQPSQKQDVSHPQPHRSVADRESAANPHGYAEVAEVADRSGGKAENAPLPGFDEDSECVLGDALFPPESPGGVCTRAAANEATSSGQPPPFFSMKVEEVERPSSSDVIDGRVVSRAVEQAPRALLPAPADNGHPHLSADEVERLADRAREAIAEQREEP
jgi:Protein of unknown function (DUF3631)/Toprim-like